MIYKCKNCGMEYDVFPEYCDCGNNSFDKTGEEVNQDINKQADTQHNNNSYFNDTKQNVEDEYDEYGEKITDNNFKISPDNNKDLSLLYHPNFNYTKNNNEKNDNNKKNILPVIIFIISLFVSVCLVVAAFIMPVSNKNKDISEKQTERVQPKATDISEFWDNTPIIQKETEIANNIKKSVKDEKATKTSEQKNITKSNTKQNTNNNQKNIIKTKSEIKKLSKSENKNENKSLSTITKNTNKQSIDNKPKSDEKKEITKPSVSTGDIKAINTYKANLRQALFSVFPILNVQGSGTASVAFSINADGKLLNRRFISQSNNKSLNDAMYHMLMKTPSYKIPPKAYKGEEFVLEMKFNNGQYSFSYLK